MEKPVKRKNCSYPEENMKQALQAVKTGTPLNTASKMFKVPRSSLHSKVTKKYSHEKCGPGTVLSEEQEQAIVEWIIKMSNAGCPVTKEHLINSVAVFLKKSKQPNCFTNNRPGRHWYDGFLRRHPQLTKRISENVSLARAMVSEDFVRQWFCNIENYIKQENLESIEACRVFNTDETSLMLNPKKGTVLTAKGTRNVYSVVNTNEKVNLTVLVTGNAAGQLAPTLIVFNYQRVPASIYATLPKNFYAGSSEKGWMTAVLFYEYIVNKFHPWLIQNKIKLPVILFVDGHVSHMTQPLSEFCNRNQIILIALPPNTTHFLQPMDVSVFSSLKANWRKFVNSYRIQKEVLSVIKEDFSGLLKRVFDNMNFSTILANGFRVCGLHPLSVEAVDFSKVFIKSKENTEPAVTENIEATKDSVILIEKYIEPAKLEIFRLNKDVSEWQGPVEDQNLFYCWRNILKNSINEFVAESQKEPSITVTNTEPIITYHTGRTDFRSKGCS